MTVEIQDNGRYYMIKNVNWLTVKNGELIVNYKGEDGEIHEEIGSIPEYMRAMWCD